MDETCWFEAVQLNDSDLVETLRVFYSYVCDVHFMDKIYDKNPWCVFGFREATPPMHPGKQTIQAVQSGAPWVMWTSVYKP